MCDSTPGLLCPSPMEIHQCVWIQWSILLNIYMYIQKAEWPPPGQNAVPEKIKKDPAIAVSWVAIWNRKEDWLYHIFKLIILLFGFYHDVWYCHVFAEPEFWHELHWSTWALRKCARSVFTEFQSPFWACALLILHLDLDVKWVWSVHLRN